MRQEKETDTQLEERKQARDRKIARPKNASARLITKTANSNTAENRGYTTDDKNGRQAQKKARNTLLTAFRAKSTLLYLIFFCRWVSPYL